jgi:signal transduction histidine kinase
MQVTPAIQNAKLYQQSTALSQQKERSSALDEENRELQRVADARSQFLSTVSHELRTPLTAISAFSDILAHNRPGNLEERQLSQINAIRRSTTSLSNLVDDLLDVSRADSGKLSLDTAPFDFQELISDFAPLAEGVASQKNQIVNIVNFEEPILLNGDRSRFNQVLNNLISNASKYSPENSEITVTMSHLSGHIEVEIADQGIGIAPHNLGSVFVPFFRAEDQETQKQSGTGLGLSVVKTLIQLHGGRVNIESTPGVGTKVKFWVPGVID